MTETPIADFLDEYSKSGVVRAHMPGHKGTAPFSQFDITEVSGADELYASSGIIARSEQIAASIFGTARTVYSTEGSSLAIRAMLYLALINAKAQGMGDAPYIIAGRNAHRVFVTASALMDISVEWLYPEEGEGLLSCSVTAQRLASYIIEAEKRTGKKPIAVYLTSPDYLGKTLDIASLAEICNKHGLPLLIDNAHGAYLKFLPKNIYKNDLHPISLGAAMCCDSAHKTLPCLTGAAYLHISKTAPAVFSQQAERAMALFASTSPSYLILRSLDEANPYLKYRFGERLAEFLPLLEKTRAALRERGYTLVENEPMKLTIAAGEYGWTGDALHEELRKKGIECEFSDPDFLVIMPTPELGGEKLKKIESALSAVERRRRIENRPPAARPVRAISPRQALFADRESVAIEAALGRIVADDMIGCPPAVPIAVSGERLDEAALACFKYYGLEYCSVVKE